MKTLNSQDKRVLKAIINAVARLEDKEEAGIITMDESTMLVKLMDRADEILFNK